MEKETYYLAEHSGLSRAILPAPLANHRLGFDLSCPFKGLAI